MVTANANATSGAAQPAALPNADSGVPQPAAIPSEANNSKRVSSLHLSELNARSANLGYWDVAISNHGLRNGHGKIRTLAKQNTALPSAAYSFQFSIPVNRQWLNKPCAPVTKGFSNKLSSVSKKTPLFA